MGFADIVIMAVILGAAALLFYRSAIKKKGHCQGCDSSLCDRQDRTARLPFRRVR